MTDVKCAEYTGRNASVKGGDVHRSGNSSATRALCALASQPPGEPEKHADVEEGKQDAQIDSRDHPWHHPADATTKSVARQMPQAFLAAAKAATGGQVVGEFLQSQVEVKTLPHADIKTAQLELRHLRQTVARVAAEHGLAILAAGTHPTADWGKSQQTESERYDVVMDELQMIGQRNMLCGLHVHVELPHPDERVDVMTRMLPYLPLFIALATSSPFWRSRPTGLKGYRLAA